MNTPNRSDTQNGLNRVLEKIFEIAEKSADGNYIFRGEIELHEEKPYYGRVSSNLYRQYLEDIEEEDFEIEFVQKEILDEAKKYSNKEDFEILTALQHYGSKTNLIDFTTDYLIALFFACDGSSNKDGRVILQERSSVEPFLKQPHEPKNRVIAQKSVFVRPPRGYIDPDQVITIESSVKQPILEYLRNSHNISTETIYNDLHGFITNRGIHESAYTQFHKAMTCYNRGELAKKQLEKNKWYDKAIECYTEAIRLKPDFSTAYNNRGIVYEEKGKIDLAIADYKETMQLDPSDPAPYSNRGNIYRDKGEFQLAFSDYERAIELDPKFSGAYNNRGLAYYGKGDYDRAIRDYNAAIKLKPTFADAYVNRSNAYTDKGDSDKSLKDLNMAVKLNPQLFESYYNRGIVYYKMDEIDLALADFNRAIELNPEAALIYNNRALAYDSQKEFDRALEDFNKAIELDPNFATAL